jgi:DNA-binding beta-propeller fold protein YncE
MIDPKILEGAMGFRAVEGWGKLPPGWSFVEATSVGVDSHDNVHVFNRGQHPVIVFDRDGIFLRSWGEGVFRRAHGITIGPDDTMWLTDDLHHTIRQFSPDGKLLLTIGNPDQASTLHGGKPFNRPTHVALCPRTGNVYISDGYGNSHVHKYDPKGRLLKSWGGPGTDPGQFNIPHNIATDSAGLVYVADRENSRVQLFGPDGAFVSEWTGIARPCQVFIDARDNVFVAEVGYRAGMWPGAEPPCENPPGGRVSVFNTRGELQSRWGGGENPCAPGDFYAPHDVCADSRGDLYVGEVIMSAGGYRGLISPDCHALQKFVRVN